MQKGLIVTAAVLLFFMNAVAGSIPSSAGSHFSAPSLTKPAENVPLLSTLKIKQVENLLGRKLTLKEKITVTFFRWRLQKSLHPGGINGTGDKGKTALILGLIGAVVLLIPILDLASIPLAILAIVIGNKAKRENPRDRKARIGVTLGIAILALLVSIGLIVALVLTIGSVPR